MKSPWLKLLALGGLFALLAPELLSHGGRFKPGLRGLGGAAPGGALPTAPPSGGGGTGNGPPPGTGELVPPNRTGWGSGGRTASPPKQGGTRTGGAVPTPGVAIPSAGQRAGRGAMTGSSRAQPTDDTDQWQQWWEFNKEPLLALKRRLLPVRTESPDTGSSAASTAPPGRASRTAVRNVILPALVEALGEDDADIVDSATLAIGRAVGGADLDLAYRAIMTQLASGHESVREAAALSLGLLGDDRAAATLGDLVRDTPRARTVLNLANGTPTKVRAFAAIALGLIGANEAMPTLKWAIEKEPGTQRDLKTCAIIALGLLANRDEALVSYLMRLIDDRDLDRTVRAHVPTVIARCASAATAAVPALYAMLERDSTDRDMLRSVVLALGKLATMDQPVVVDALRRTALEDPDPGARNFAWIALAEIGARDHEPGGHADLHRTLAQLLMEGAQHPEVATAQPWASLALALYARAHPEASAAAVQCLRAAYPRVENPSTRAALAVSLGLLDAAECAPMLMKEMLELGAPELRGYVALSLGLMRQTAAAPLLRKQIQDPGIDWRFRMNLARGLGLMADVQAVPALIGALGAARGLADAASLAQALGLIGDESAIEPLKTILKDGKRIGMQRGFAAVALGLLGEKTELPWHARISIGLNYRARTPALEELLDIL